MPVTAKESTTVEKITLIARELRIRPRIRREVVLQVVLNSNEQFVVRHD
jgi:hypothetical protein